MAKTKTKPVKGVFEKVPGSDIWWIRYSDAQGRYRREKAGARGPAIALYQKRKTEALQGRKLPETIKRKAVLVSDLLDLASEHVANHYRRQRLGADKKDYRYKTLKDALGTRPAESLTPRDIDKELSKLATDREWKPASYNRHKALLSLAYRLGIENDLLSTNPVRLVRRRRENNGVIRWLTPDEETKVVAAIQSDHPDELPAFQLALHTGMRKSEQYGLTWDCVDLIRKQITIPQSKHGGIRYVPLDKSAVDALLTLRSRGDGTGKVMVLAKSGHGYQAGHTLKTPKEWFLAVCRKAGVSGFTWHCLRHTFCSRLVMAGTPLAVVKELMGHKSVLTTMRYAHLAPNHGVDAVAKLDDWKDQFGGANQHQNSTDNQMRQSLGKSEDEEVSVQ